MNQVARAKRIVTQLLGADRQPRTAIDKVDIETGDVSAMEVRHELGPKLESEGYRTRSRTRE